MRGVAAQLSSHPLRAVRILTGPETQDRHIISYLRSPKETEDVSTRPTVCRTSNRPLSNANPIVPFHLSSHPLDTHH